jgi:hypothetical protein
MSMLAKFNQIPSSQEFSIKISLILTQRSFSEFYFKIHLESEEVSIRKVISYLKHFPDIFYFNFLSSGMSFFNQSNFE